MPRKKAHRLEEDSGQEMARNRRATATCHTHTETEIERGRFRGTHVCVELPDEAGEVVVLEVLGQQVP
jgi:predicted DNA-binding protein with PD1-like motif